MVVLRLLSRVPRSEFDDEYEFRFGWVPAGSPSWRVWSALTSLGQTLAILMRFVKSDQKLGIHAYLRVCTAFLHNYKYTGLGDSVDGAFVSQPEAGEFRFSLQPLFVFFHWRGRHANRQQSKHSSG